MTSVRETQATRSEQGRAPHSRQPRGWWVGLACRLYGGRVKAGNGKFSRPVNEDGTPGEPWAEHHAGDCEREAGEG